MAADPAPTPQIDFDANSVDVRLNVSFPADPARLADMVSAIMVVVGAMHCADGHEQEIELALHEAVANAVKHGAGSDPAKSVNCTVACEEKHGMLIVVSDPGNGFDPQNVPNPLIGENLYSDHGRGIYMINRLMDQVEYKKGGTEIHMRKFFKNGNNDHCAK